MARYIDADKVHKFVDEKVAEGKDGWAKGVPYEWSYALTVIDMQPAADVVPKSEVDDLIRFIIRNEDIAIKCKRENGEQNEEYWKGKLSAFLQIRGYIDAELKKKYTEDQT